MATTEQSSTIGERVSRIEGGYEHLATKADLGDLKSELKAEIADVRSELKAEIADVKSELKAEVADVKSEVAGLRGDVRGIKWWIISIGSAAVILSGLAQLLPLGG